MSLSATLFINQEIVEVNQEQIELLKKAATEETLKRSRLCLHNNHDDPVQEMIIALCKESYVRPHRHSNKSESFHIIEGELMVVFFDNMGRVIRKIEMSALGNDKTSIYRLNNNMWHTVVPCSEFVVLHETTTGPFIEGKNEYAAWSPDYGDKSGIRRFMERIETVA